MAAEALIGESRVWSGVQATDLTQALQQMMSSDACWGLVWRLDRIAWLQGQAGQALLLHASVQNQAGGTTLLSAAELLRIYPSGRVFDEQYELRWQSDGAGAFAVLGLAEDSQALEVIFLGATAERQSDWQVIGAHWRLAGSIISEREDDPLAKQTWYETRFPKSLVYPYPVTHGGDRQRQPRLAVRVYKDANAAVRLVRFCGVDTEKE